MYKPAHGTHLASSFAMSGFVVLFLLAPGQVAAGQAYNVATEVMMEDISTQLQLAGDISGGPVSTGNTGLSAVQSDGSAYAFSFTAGGVSVTDSSTFTPDGLAPGTGTWAITSSLIQTGSASVSYDTGSSTYCINLLISPGDPTIAGTNVKYTDMTTRISYDDAKGVDAGFQYWWNGAVDVKANMVAYRVLTSSLDAKTGKYEQTWSPIKDPTGTAIPGAMASALTGNGTSFTGTTTVPEPSANILLAIGTAAVLACRSSHGRKRLRQERLQSAELG